MTEAELVLYCRELTWITRGWQGAAGVLLICCVWFGCRYHFDAGIRLPRLRATLKRVAGERDEHKAQAARLVVELATMRMKSETIGREAEKEIARVDAIRKKTEAALVEEKATSEALRTFLEAVEAQRSARAGDPNSWVPAELAAAART